MMSPHDEWVGRVLGVERGNEPVPAPVVASPLQLWLSAKEAAGVRISALQTAMRDVPHPMFARLADRGLNGITGRLQVGLQAALLELEGGGGAVARRKAAAAVATFRQFLATDPVVRLVDLNPLGVAVDLQRGLEPALAAIERALAA